MTTTTTTDQPPRITGAGRRYRARQSLRGLQNQLPRTLRVAAAIGPSADALAKAAAELAPVLERYQAEYVKVRRAARDVGITDERWTLLEGV